MGSWGRRASPARTTSAPPTTGKQQLPNALQSLAKDESGVQILNRPTTGGGLSSCCLSGSSHHRDTRWNPPADKLAIAPQTAVQSHPPRDTKIPTPPTPDALETPQTKRRASRQGSRPSFSRSGSSQGIPSIAKAELAWLPVGLANDGGFQTLSNLPALSVPSVASVHSPSLATRRRSGHAALPDGNR